MNKSVVNREITLAYDALKNVGVAKDGKISRAFRGQISSFGAAITMGSLLPAIAFFSEQGGASVERQKLMDAILDILKADGLAAEGCKTLFDHAKQQNGDCQENIINASIALKLAMNLYILE